MPTTSTGPKPDFASDGCTGWFDGSWRECCVAHDLAYYTDTVNWQSHVDLGLCVFDSGGTAIIGLLMTVATTIWWRTKRFRR